jgi:hypothetical protein
MMSCEKKKKKSKQKSIGLGINNDDAAALKIAEGGALAL